MEAKKTEDKPVKPRAPKRIPPWWDGLRKEAAEELLQLGYRSREEAALFLNKPRFVNPSKRGQRTVYDPLHVERPWLGGGVPKRIPLALHSEVREWLEKVDEK